MINKLNKILSNKKLNKEFDRNNTKETLLAYDEVLPWIYDDKFITDNINKIDLEVTPLVLEWMSILVWYESPDDIYVDKYCNMTTIPELLANFKSECVELALHEEFERKKILIHQLVSTTLKPYYYGYRIDYVTEGMTFYDK
ncbi:hypothetical protein [Macrococcus equi]|uniref:hypothetical protein n=1 Tax=Macrococcus equi TaxID=3395462 RepID=UPI0039BE5D98